MKVVLSTLNAKFIHSSLALRYLRGYCRPVCPDMHIKEYTINNELLYILSDLYSERPDVLGLACYIWNIEATLDLVRLVKKVLPETIIILGGPEVTYDPAEIIEANAEVDYIIQGEGEVALAALLSALRQGKRADAIEGVTGRQNGVACAGNPQVVAELDSIPFPYCADDMSELKDKIVYYESSRGCPFSCQYCLSSATAGVRFFSLERVLADLAFFIEHDVKQVKFVDRTFNARRDHYWPILRFLAEAECRTNFHFEIAADLLDDETLEFLRNAPKGRFQMEVGIQSTNPATLTEIQRKNNWPLITHNVKAINSFGNIHLHLDLIAGLPYEDLQRFGQSFNDVYSLRPDMLQLGFLKMLRGSGMRRSAAKHGYKYMDKAPYEVLANNYMDYGDIRRLKILEDVFNHLYNSGRFAVTLDWLVAGYNDGDAFGFYNAFTGYWEERKLHLAAHGVKALYRFLVDYCEEKRPGQTEFCRELLRFDALLCDNGNLRPDFLPWDGDQWNDEKNAFWRDETRVRKYLPDYRFTTWRELKKNYHIEVFTVDVPEYLRRGELKANATVVLFAFAGERSSYQVVDGGDFWEEGN